MEGAISGFTSIGEAIGADTSRRLDALVAKGPRLSEFGTRCLTLTKDFARISDQYVRKHRWKVVGISAAVGMIMGVLLGRDNARARHRLPDCL